MKNGNVEGVTRRIFLWSRGGEKLLGRFMFKHITWHDPI